MHRFLLAASLLFATACKGKSVPPPALTDAGADAGSMTPLQRVARIVIPNCAIAGCHDAVSKTHAMDLSTPEKIRAAWINQPGFDHCTGLDTPRVIPGDASGSLVMMKIEGLAVCAQSQRMPLPPRDALTIAQIAVIRDWILSGAPGDDPVPEDAGLVDAGDASGDAGSDAGAPECSAENPCEPGLSCVGVSCGDPWVCVHHYDPIAEHPCSEEMLKYCGCDGVTYEASATCPDKPWLHIGACDDGFSCAKQQVECEASAPECPPGQAPSVAGTCWGPCVPLEECRCLYDWMCPSLDEHVCSLETYRCGPKPSSTDAGAP